MPPNTDYLTKLRFARIYILEQIEKATEPFDRECLCTSLQVIEREIDHAEYVRLLGGKA